MNLFAERCPADYTRSEGGKFSGKSTNRSEILILVSMSSPINSLLSLLHLAAPNYWSLDTRKQSLAESPEE